MEVLKYRENANAEWKSIIAIKGDKGDPGSISFEELTEEQKAALKGDPGDDYVLTEADKQEIATIVIESLPAAEGVGF